MRLFLQKAVYTIKTSYARCPTQTWVHVDNSGGGPEYVKMGWRNTHSGGVQQVREVTAGIPDGQDRSRRFPRFYPNGIKEIQQFLPL